MALAGKFLVKVFLYGLAGLFVLLVAAALIGPSLIDWNAHKDLIAAEVRKATGRDLAIDGDVSLAVLPAPALSADRVRLANIDGGSQPTMAELRELRVRIALWPLLGRRIQVESVSLVEPRILLEVLADGRRNWDFGPAAPDGGTAPRPAEPESEEGLAGQIQLDRFEIVSGTVVYRDATSGTEEQIEALDARIAAESLSGPFAAEGDLRLRGLPADFELAVGRVLRDGATPLNLAFELPSPGVRTALTGSFSLHADRFSFRGQVKAEGDDLAAAIRTLSADSAGSLPGYLGRPFSLRTDVSGDLDHVEGADLRVEVGEASLAGKASIRFGPPADIAVSLAATRIDLDQLLRQADTAPAAPAAGPDTAAPAGPSAAQSPAQGFRLPDDVKARLELAIEGLVYRGQAMRQVRLDAALGDGRLTVDTARALLPGGSNLTLNGLLAPQEGKPRFWGRLEATSDNVRALAAWLGAAPEAVPADRLRRMSFSAKVDATPEQVGLENIDLRLDLSRMTGGLVVALRQRLALGVGLALDSLNLDAYLPEAADRPGEPAQPGGHDGGDATGQPRLNTGPLAVLKAFDANLNLKVGSLSWQSQTVKNLRVKGTLRDGSLTLRETAFDELAGTRGSFTGTIRDLAAAPEVDGELELEATKPRRLAKVLDIDPAGVARLGRLVVKTKIKATGEDLSFDGEIAVQGGSLDLAGTVQPNARPLSFDVVVAARHPDLSGLFTALGGAAGRRANLGPLDLKGQVSGTPLKLSARELSGRVGGTDLSGRLSADLSGPRPAVDAELALGDLALATLVAPTAGGKASAPPGGAAKGPKSRWSKEPIDLSWLTALDADVALTARSLTHDKLRFQDVALEADLTNGVLDLKRLTGTLYGGAVQVVGKIRGTRRVDAGVAVTALNVQSGALLREQADFKRVSGPVDLTAELTAAGASEAEFVSSLTGKGNIKGTLTYKLEKEEQIGNLALNILGAKVKQVRGIADASTMLLSAFAGAPAGLDGSFTIEKGVINTRDTTIDGRDARALTQARADLGRWRLDSRTDVYRDEDPKSPYLTAELEGPLDEPNVRVGGQPFQRRTQPQDDPERSSEPEKIEPKDIIKDLLRGLGN